MWAQVLVLNASYEPLGVTSWQKAISKIVVGKFEMVERNPDGTIRHGESGEFPLPAVVRLTYMVNPRMSRQSMSRVPYAKATVHLRDSNECQVRGCDNTGTTIDHLIPKSRGGELSYTNSVSMCFDHNSAKGNQTMAECGYQLKRSPKAPAFEVVAAMHAQRRLESRQRLAESALPSWRPYLGIE